MQPKQHQETAILVFAHSTHEEKNHKNINHGELLFDILTNDTLAKVRRTKLPYFHFTEHQQCGNSFGERFTHAIETIFDLGYNNIITVGNDCPQLQTRHLLIADEALATGKTVLGPTVDGGFYLMGLNRKSFDKTLFLRLPWQRFGLFNRISKLIKTVSPDLISLPLFHDIDNDADVARLANFTDSIAARVLKKLRALVFSINTISCEHLQIQKEYYTSIFYNKGSPVYAFA